MEEIFENVKQTPGSVKFPLKVKERQSKTNIPKIVKKLPIGLPLSPKQFKEFDGVFLHWSSNRESKL